MTKLTYRERQKLPTRAFAIDHIERRYPIHDLPHARNALARVSAFGTAKEKAIVRKAVYRRYPGLKPPGYRLRRRNIRISPRIPRLR